MTESRPPAGAIPIWWVALVGAGFAAAAGYWLFHSTFGAGHSPLEAYQEDKLAAMSTGGPVPSEELVALTEDPDLVAAGRALYDSQCAECHKSDGSGDKGPNLTDRYWLHGHTPSEIHQTIDRGVPDKGMPVWGTRLGAGKVLQVTAYVLTLRGGERPGKAPEGEPEPE